MDSRSHKGWGGGAPVSEGPRPWWRPRPDGLAPRVAAYLSVALLPLGLIALYQTREYQQETEERAELSLLALTEQGAAALEEEIKQAIGAGEALGAVVGLLDDPATCAQAFGRFVGAGRPYAFAGIVPPEGPVTCSSVPGPFDLGDRESWADLVAAPGPVLRGSPAGTVSGEDVLIVAVPIAPLEAPADAPPDAPAGLSALRPSGDPADAPGFIALSIPRGRVEGVPFGLSELRPLRLVTFNAQGDVLTNHDGDEASPLADALPPGRGLASQAGGKPRVFEAESAAGDRRVYTVAPLVPGTAWAMGIWTPEQAGQGIGGVAQSPLLFPLLMWGVSLAVAFWAINRLVIHRVTDLAGRMRRFGRDRSVSERPSTFGAPFELREIEDSFHQMADSILRDEARMENAFRERGVLLREVHHRVKNNLQLISSIISMQLRRLPEPRVRPILRRLQDRVLTLASIYRSLYTSPDMGDVNAAPVIRAIVEQELRAAPDRVEATLDMEDMVLDPDKVVPLAFLAAEAVSNALARAGSGDGKPSLSVTLHREDGQARLSIANSLAGAPDGPDPAQGLGQHLIQAFAAQVGGAPEVQADDRLYRLSVRFPLEAAPAETVPA